MTPLPPGRSSAWPGRPPPRALPARGQPVVWGRECRHPALLPSAPAHRPAARARPTGGGRLAGRRLGSPVRLGVPEALSCGGRRHRGPGPPQHRPRRGRQQPPGRRGRPGRGPAPATVTAGTALEALGAILVCRLVLAAITVPRGRRVDHQLTNLRLAAYTAAAKPSSSGEPPACAARFASRLPDGGKAPERIGAFYGWSR